MYIYNTSSYVTFFKHNNDYGLTIGQEFESTTELVEYTNKSRNTITQWRQKEWIN